MMLGTVTPAPADAGLKANFAIALIKSVDTFHFSSKVQSCLLPQTLC